MAIISLCQLVQNVSVQNQNVIFFANFLDLNLKNKFKKKIKKNKNKK